MRIFFLLITCTAIHSLLGQVPCVGGKAGGYDCFGIDLKSSISAPELGAEELDGRWINDIWGWVDPETQKEYALVGMTNGTSFVDVTDPVNPVVLGILPEHNSIGITDFNLLHDGAKSIWRDIKVYQNHAFIVSEDANHGIQVFDLTRLREVSEPSKSLFFSEDGHYPGLGQAHNISINESTGFLYAVGFLQSGNFQCNGGGLHIVDLADPKNPIFAGCFDISGYIHDTQCVVYDGPDTDYIGSEICFSSNGNQNGKNTITIVNVDNKEAAALISEIGYEDSYYAHQGWLTEDHRYFLTNDELDEVTLQSNTRTFIWDMKDLDSPKLLGFYEHNSRSIDHNLYVKGDYVFQSNYTSGLVVLDTMGIHRGLLRPVAFFDTYISNNSTSFAGSWSNYPYLPSGNIIVSDITNGLFVLKIQELFISQQPEDIEACIGDHINILVSAEGDGLSYQWQIDKGDGFQDISNFERYINTRTNRMHAHSLELAQDNFQFRCIISKGELEVISDPVSLFIKDSARAEMNIEILNDIGNVSFVNNSLNSEAYLWDFGDGTTSMLESPVHRYAFSGTYKVSLFAENQCSTDSISKMLDLIVLSLEQENSSYQIYPTITSDLLYLQVSPKRSFTYSLYSLGGVKILTGSSSTGEEILNLQSIQKGIYLLKVVGDLQSFSSKIIVR